MMKLWVDTWKQAGPELEAIRRREVEQADNTGALALFDMSFRHAVQTLPFRESSGLVVMRDWFAKMRP